VLTSRFSRAGKTLNGQARREIVGAESAAPAANAPNMATTVRRHETSTDQVIHLSVSWQAYEALSDSLGDASNARLTYDGATLEIMAPGFRHEGVTARFTELLRDVKGEWHIGMRSTRSSRFKSAFLENGFEADESYYIASAPKISDWRNIDLAIDPPPDLVIEVDISGKRKNKDTYARVGVPEFWRYSEGDGLEAFALVKNTFVPIATSRIIPGLPIVEIGGRVAEESETLEALNAWRDWLRTNRPR
jgi:Uma2 family endonuclease